MNKKIIVIALAVVFVIGGVLIGFGGKTPFNTSDEQGNYADEGYTHGPSGEPTSGDAGESVKIDLDSVPKILAKINGKEITSENYKRIVGNIQKQFEQSGQLLTQDKLDAINNDVISNIVNSELLYMESVAKNIQTTGKRIEARLQQFRGQFKSEDEFKKALAEGNTTLDELREEIKKSSQIEILLEKNVLSRISVTQQDALEYYDKNSEVFNRPKTIKARHILLRLKPDADKKTTAEVESRMKEIVEKDNSGKDFGELAKKFSEGPSAVNGGDLGFFPRGVMAKAFEDAAFALKRGEVSDVVRTQFGLHLIEVTDVKDGGLTEFKEIKENIMRNLETKARDDLLKAYINSLKEQADIRILI